MKTYRRLKKGISIEHLTNKEPYLLSDGWKMFDDVPLSIYTHKLVQCQFNFQRTAGQTFFRHNMSRVSKYVD